MPSPADPSDDTAKSANASDDNKEAVELIRGKIDKLYAEEPDAKEEAAEAEIVHPRSKHQEFMHSLSTGGKTLAEIQVAWHNYYTGLSDKEKHEVWQEFYANQAKGSTFGKPAAPTEKTKAVQHQTHNVPAQQPAPATRSAEPRGSVADFKQHLLNTISQRARLSHKHKHHLKSLGFGLGMGTLVVVIMLFGFFNERFIAPFITPSRTVSSTPIITDVVATAESIPANPVIIIPKINIEIPVIYDEESIDEAAVQRALEDGILHYPTTSDPGETGNAVFFGHSSSNLLNNGRYKFAFVLLHRLETGDTFMIQKDSKRYVYKVFEKRVVKPTELSVLNNRDRPTATLITCDPPGSSANRLVVVAEQISPDPATNVAVEPADEVATPEILPSDARTLWSRLWAWIST